MGLKVNVDKIKTMESRTRREQCWNIRYYRYYNIILCDIGVMLEFIYLGSTVNSYNNLTHEIKNRILKVNRALYAL